jgi:Flp pilus assembly pilin Flp
MRRDTRGTTMVEYGLLLFVVLVVCAVGIKVLGITLQHKFKQANNSVAGQPEPAAAGQQQPNYGGTGVASASPSAPPRATDTNKDPTSTTGGGPGEKEGQVASGLPMIARFALLALGVIGTVAAFFAMKKQKTG